MNALETRVPPPLVLLIAAGALWALARLTGAMDLPGWLRHEGALGVALLGIAVLAAGVVSFWRASTTVNPMRPQAASALVDRGIYRLTRNPMYLGDALLLLAWGLYLAAPVATLVAVAAFVLYIDRFQIRAEERALQASFGAEYAAYRERVRRWL